jgi:acyl-CoA synthetase (NDP forming)
MNAQKLIDKFRPLFYPESIAVLGASENPSKWGFAVTHNLIRHDFSGRIYPVNPMRSEILGLKAYPSLAELPERVDLAMVVIPAQKASGVIEELARLQIPACFMITSGFGETGEQGRQIEKRMAEQAEQAGIIFAGPNGQGLACPEHNMYAMMGSMQSPAGSVAIVSQSGNIGATAMGFLAFSGLGTSKFVSSGNETSLRTEDYIEYYTQDPQTSIIVSYMEGTKDGRRWFDKVRRSTRKKPLVLLKGGSTEVGGLAAASHTGALAGNQALFSAACKQAGVILVEELDELYDVVFNLHSQPLMKGNRIGIVTMGGGWGVMAADACIRNGLLVPQLDEETMRELDKLLPAYWSHGNPVDLAAGAGDQVPLRCTEALLKSKNIDAVITMGAGYPSMSSQSIKRSPFYPNYNLDKQAAFAAEQDEKSCLGLVEAIKKSGKPVIPCSELGYYSKINHYRGIEILEENGIFVVPTPQRAARVLRHLADYGKYRLHNTEV